MKTKPQVISLPEGCCWIAELELLRACVYVPHTDLPDDLLNFGYEAPYLLVFEDQPSTPQAAADFALQRNRFQRKIARLPQQGEGGRLPYRKRGVIPGRQRKRA